MASVVSRRSRAERIKRSPFQNIRIAVAELIEHPLIVY
jgi:hypothetical protein